MPKPNPVPCDCGNDHIIIRQFPKGEELYVMAVCRMCGRCGPCVTGPNTPVAWSRLDRKAIAEWNRIQGGKP